jgi:hypothetical protein
MMSAGREIVTRITIMRQTSNFDYWESWDAPEGERESPAWYVIFILFFLWAIDEFRWHKESR